MTAAHASEFTERMCTGVNSPKQELIWAKGKMPGQKLLLSQPPPPQCDFLPLRSPARLPQQPCSASKMTVYTGTEQTERRVFKSQRPGTGVEASGQLNLSSREVQRTTVNGFTHANGSSEIGGIFFLQVVIGMKPGKRASQLTAR